MFQFWTYLVTKDMGQGSDMLWVKSEQHVMGSSYHFQCTRQRRAAKSKHGVGWVVSPNLGSGVLLRQLLPVSLYPKAKQGGEEAACMPVAFSGILLP